MLVEVGIGVAITTAVTEAITVRRSVTECYDLLLVYLMIASLLLQVDKP